GNALVDSTKTLEHDAKTFFRDPLRVVALLRQGPTVALDNYRQVELQSFADRTRPRFSNKEIRKCHVVIHAGREAFREDGEPGFQSLGGGKQLLVFSTDNDQLQLRIAGVQRTNDLQNCFRPVSSEQDNSGRRIWIQAQTLALLGNVDLGLLVEFRLEHHSGDQKYVVLV